MALNKQNKSFPLLICAILFAVFQGAGIVLYFFEDYYDLSWIIESILMMAIGFGLYESYRSHTKNVTKMLLGGLLFLILDYTASYGTYYAEYLKECLTSENVLYAIYGVATVAVAVVVLLLNINHYAINATHHSSPKKVKFNVVLYYAFFLCVLAQSVTCLIADEFSLFEIAGALTTVSDAFLIILIVSIERNSDEFRLAREEAGNEVFDVVEEAPKGKGKHLLINASLFALCEIASMVGGVVEYDFLSELPWIINVLCLIAVCFGIYITYKKHIKNLTKPLVGAALILVLDYYISSAFGYIQYFNELNTWYENGNAMVAYAICNIVSMVAIAVITVLYIVINSTHESSPKEVRWTQFFSMLFVLASIAEAVTELFFGDTVFGMLYYGFEPLSKIFVTFIVLNIVCYAEQGRQKREAEKIEA